MTYFKPLCNIHSFHNWGLAIFEDEMQYFDLTVNEAAEYISPQTYLSTVLQVTGLEDYLSKSSIQFVLDYLNQETIQCLEILLEN
jgi:hypothetical protein